LLVIIRRWKHAQINGDRWFSYIGGIVLSSAFYIDKSRARREAATDFFWSVIFLAESIGVMNAWWARRMDAGVGFCRSFEIYHAVA